MAFAIPLAMAATAVGAGVSMFGQYQAGQAQAAEYNYRQNVENQFANALDVRANALQAEGGVKQRMVGVSGAEAISAQNVFEGAKNVSLTGPAAGMIGPVRSARLNTSRGWRSMTQRRPLMGNGSRRRSGEPARDSPVWRRSKRR